MKVKFYSLLLGCSCKILELSKQQHSGYSEKLTAEIRSSAFAVYPASRNTIGALKRDKNNIHPNQNLDALLLKKTQDKINSVALSQHTSVSALY